MQISYHYYFKLLSSKFFNVIVFLNRKRCRFSTADIKLLRVLVHTWLQIFVWETVYKLKAHTVSFPRLSFSWAVSSTLNGTIVLVASQKSSLTHFQPSEHSVIGSFAASSISFGIETAEEEEPEPVKGSKAGSESVGEQQTLLSPHGMSYKTDSKAMNHPGMQILLTFETLSCNPDVADCWSQTDIALQVKPFGQRSPL